MPASSGRFVGLRPSPVGVAFRRGWRTVACGFGGVVSARRSASFIRRSASSSAYWSSCLPIRGHSMTRSRRRKQPWESVSYSHPVFRPYTMALGQIALAWNGFHSEMALLFCTVMGGGFANQFLAVWHALKNDASQRAILLAAAKDLFGYDFELGKKVFAEIEWINGQARRIEDVRDDALHSPLWPTFQKEMPVMPMTGLGHIRAQKLLEADVKRGLLNEFRWCRNAALILTRHVKEIDNLITRDPFPLLSWPRRPSLPNRGQTKSGQPRSRQTRITKPPPRPQSSRP